MTMSVLILKYLTNLVSLTVMSYCLFQVNPYLMVAVAAYTMVSWPTSEEVHKAVTDYNDRKFRRVTQILKENVQDSMPSRCLDIPEVKKRDQEF